MKILTQKIYIKWKVNFRLGFEIVLDSITTNNGNLIDNIHGELYMNIEVIKIIKDKSAFSLQTISIK